MEEITKPLFKDFKASTKAEWRERVDVDLKGADFDRKLVWKNINDIDIQPYYTTEDDLTILKNPGENSQSVVNYRSISAESGKEGNRLALKAVEEGMTGLLFKVKTGIKPKELLDGIDLSSIAVSFVLHEKSLEFAKEFFEFVGESKISDQHLGGFMDLKLISNYLTTGKLDEEKFDTLKELMHLASAYPNFKTVSLSGTEYMDSGANEVQEIAYTLNSLVFLIEKLNEKNVAVQDIFNNLHLQLAVGPEYFIEIAKLRAFNNLLRDVAGKYEVSTFRPMLTAKTSIWSKSNIDAYTNLLRETTETMAAVLGNVDGVLIDAYDSGFYEPTDFSSRIAGNTLTILREESYLGRVANPVDGSYYIEEVGTQLAERALQLFKAVEAKGGFYKAFEEEVIQDEIAQMRLEKLKLLSQRRLAMVGVNKYPNAMETVDMDVLSDGGKSNTKTLKPRRATLEMEALRKTTEQLVAKTGTRPTVELACFGDLTMRKARSTFANDFLGVGGFMLLPEESYSSAAEAAKASAESDSQIVVMCSSDKDYEADALNFIKTFRDLNSNKVLLLAGNPRDQRAELDQAGLDDCIHLKSDSIQTISVIQNKIKKYL